MRLGPRIGERDTDTTHEDEQAKSGLRLGDPSRPVGEPVVVARDSGQRLGPTPAELRAKKAADAERNANAQAVIHRGSDVGFFRDYGKNMATGIRGVLGGEGFRKTPPPPVSPQPSTQPITQPPAIANPAAERIRLQQRAAEVQTPTDPFAPRISNDGKIRGTAGAEHERRRELAKKPVELTNADRKILGESLAFRKGNPAAEVLAKSLGGPDTPAPFLDQYPKAPPRPYSREWWNTTEGQLEALTSPMPGFRRVLTDDEELTADYQDAIKGTLESLGGDWEKYSKLSPKARREAIDAHLGGMGRPEQMGRWQHDALQNLRNVAEDPIKLVPFLAGVDELSDAKRLYDAGKALETGSASEADIQVIEDMLTRAEIASLSSDTFGGSVTNILAQLPAFAGEFAATGGAYTAGRKIGTKGATSFLRKFAEAKAGRLAVGGVSRGAGVLAQTATASAPRIAADYTGKVTNGFIRQGDGSVKADPTAAMSGYEAAYKSLANAVIEVGSERSGGMLNKLFKGIGGKIVAKVPGSEKALNDMRRAIGKYVAINPDESMADIWATIAKNTGFHGPLGEFGEERVGDIMRAIFLGEVNMPDTRQYLAELASFTAPGAGRIAFDTALRNLKVRNEAMTPEERDAADRVILRGFDGGLNEAEQSLRDDVELGDARQAAQVDRVSGLGEAGRFDNQGAAEAHQTRDSQAETTEGVTEPESANAHQKRTNQPPVQETPPTPEAEAQPEPTGTAQPGPTESPAEGAAEEPPGPTEEEVRRQIQAELKALRERQSQPAPTQDDLQGYDTPEERDAYGGSYSVRVGSSVIHPSARAPGKVQVTHFTDEGRPSGHDEYDTLADAMTNHYTELDSPVSNIARNTPGLQKAWEQATYDSPIADRLRKKKYAYTSPLRPLTGISVEGETSVDKTGKIGVLYRDTPLPLEDMEHLSLVPATKAAVRSFAEEMAAKETGAATPTQEPTDAELADKPDRRQQVLPATLDDSGVRKAGGDGPQAAPEDRGVNRQPDNVRGHQADTAKLDETNEEISRLTSRIAWLEEKLDTVPAKARKQVQADIDRTTAKRDELMASVGIGGKGGSKIDQADKARAEYEKALSEYRSYTGDDVGKLARLDAAAEKAKREYERITGELSPTVKDRTDEGQAQVTDDGGDGARLEAQAGQAGQEAVGGVREQEGPQGEVAAKPEPMGSLAEQASQASQDRLVALRDSIRYRKKSGKRINSLDAERLRTVEAELRNREIEARQWWKLTPDQWLDGARFYRSGETKNVELPNGQTAILKNEATAGNFRQQSRDFLLKLRDNAIRARGPQAQEDTPEVQPATPRKQGEAIPAPVKPGDTITYRRGRDTETGEVIAVTPKSIGVKDAEGKKRRVRLDQVVGTKPADLSPPAETPKESKGIGEKAQVTKSDAQPAETPDKSPVKVSKQPWEMSKAEFEDLRQRANKPLDEIPSYRKSDAAKKAEFKAKMIRGELRKAANRGMRGGTVDVRRSRGPQKTEADLRRELAEAEQIISAEETRFKEDKNRGYERAWQRIQAEAPDAVAAGLVWFKDGRITTKVGLPSGHADLIKEAIARGDILSHPDYPELGKPASPAEPTSKGQNRTQKPTSANVFDTITPVDEQKGAGRTTPQPQKPQATGGYTPDRLAKSVADLGEHEVVGFRVDPDAPHQIGETLSPSRVWAESDSGEFVPSEVEQDGVSAFSKWEDARSYAQYSPGTMMVVAGERGRPQGDVIAGEVLVRNPRIVGIARRASAKDDWVISEIDPDYAGRLPSFDDAAPKKSGAIPPAAQAQSESKPAYRLVDKSGKTVSEHLTESAAKDANNRAGNIHRVEKVGEAEKRFDAGKKLTEQQKQEALSTVGDSYVDLKAPKSVKGHTVHGDPIVGYQYDPEYLHTSDITGAKIRYYITLPDGRKAHPSELFPEVNESKAAKLARNYRAQKARDSAYDAASKGIITKQEASLVNTYANTKNENTRKRVDEILNKIEASASAKKDEFDARIEREISDSEKQAADQKTAAQAWIDYNKWLQVFDDNSVTRGFGANVVAWMRGGEKPSGRLHEGPKNATASADKKGQAYANKARGRVVLVSVLDPKDVPVGHFYAELPDTPATKQYEQSLTNGHDPIWTKGTGYSSSVVNAYEPKAASASAAGREKKTNVSRPTVPEYRDWRYNQNYANRVTIIPNRVGGKFTASQLQSLVDWAKDNGLSVGQKTPTSLVISAHGSGVERLDLGRLGADGVQYEAIAAKREQREAEAEARKKKLTRDADSRESSGWILDTFGNDVLNPYNRNALSDFLEGKTKKYEGQISRWWQDGVEKANARTGDDIDWSKLKSAYEASKPQAQPAEPKTVKPSASTGAVFDYEAPSGNRKVVTLQSAKYSTLPTELQDRIKADHRAAVDMRDNDSANDLSSIMRDEKDITLETITEGDESHQNVSRSSVREMAYSMFRTRSMHDLKDNKAVRELRAKFDEGERKRRADDNERMQAENRDRAQKNRADAERKLKIDSAASAAKFKKQSFDLPNGGDKVTGVGLGGLVAARRSTMDKWRVYHAASGLSISGSRGFDTQKEARVYLVRLSGVQDWTKGKDAVTGGYIGSKTSDTVRRFVSEGIYADVSDVWGKNDPTVPEAAAEPKTEQKESPDEQSQPETQPEAQAQDAVDDGGESVPRETGNTVRYTGSEAVESLDFRHSHQADEDKPTHDTITRPDPNAEEGAKAIIAKYVEHDVAGRISDEGPSVVTATIGGKRVSNPDDIISRAFRTVAKPIPTGEAGVNVWALPGKQKDAARAVVDSKKNKKLKGEYYAATARGQDITGVKPWSGKRTGMQPYRMPRPVKGMEGVHSAVAVATARENSRYAISGILVEGKHLVATDGHRMFVVKRKELGAAKDDGIRSVDKKGNLVDHPTDAKFPPWKDVIPKDAEVVATVTNRDTGFDQKNPLWVMIHNLRLAQLMSNEEAKGVVIWKNTDGTLGFSASAPKVGMAEVGIRDGATLVAAVNPAYFIDALEFHAKLGTQEITIRNERSNKPIVTEGRDAEGRFAQTVTMPVNPPRGVGGGDPFGESAITESGLREYGKKRAAELEDAAAKKEQEDRDRSKRVRDEREKQRFESLYQRLMRTKDYQPALTEMDEADAVRVLNRMDAAPGDNPEVRRDINRAFPGAEAQTENGKTKANLQAEQPAAEEEPKPAKEYTPAPQPKPAGKVEDRDAKWQSEAAADTDKQYSRTQVNPDMPISVSHDDIPLSDAIAAHSGMSFVPERRGRQRQDDYVKDMNAAYESLAAIAKTDEQKAVLREELQRYKDGYLARYKSWLSAQSRVVSPMITGPAKFPTARNQKKGDTADRRRNELVEWDKRAMAAMQKRVMQADLNYVTPTISSDDPNAIGRLQSKLDQLESLQAKMKAVNSAHKKYLKDPSSLDKSDLDDKAKERIRNYKPAYSWEPHPYPPYALQNNNKEIKRVKDRIAQLEKASTEESSELSFDGGTITNSVEDNRVQIFFDAKPGEQVRTELKSKGFRWAPSVGAWQRQRSESAMYHAKRIVGYSEPAAESLPDKLNTLADKLQAKADKLGLQGNDPRARGGSIIGPMLALKSGIIALRASAAGIAKGKQLAEFVKTQINDHFPEYRDHLGKVLGKVQRILKASTGDNGQIDPDRFEAEIALLEKELGGEVPEPETETTPEPEPEPTTTKTRPVRKADEPVERLDPDTFSARQEQVNFDREAWGKPGLESKERRSWGEAVEKARELGLPGRAMQTAAAIIERPRAMDDIETAGLVEHGASLKRDHKRLMDEIGRSTDPAELAYKTAELSRVEQDFDILTQAIYLSGSEKGRALASQKLTLNLDMDLVSVLNRAKAKKGRDLSPAEREQLEQMTKKHEEYEAKIAELQETVDSLLAARVTRRSAHRRYSRMSQEQKDTDLRVRMARVASLLKGGCN